MVARRVAFLTDYQNAAYAARYRAWVDKARAAEAAKAPGKCGLAEAVARYLFKLMAYKDEYEVARLYSDGDRSSARSATTFDGDNLRLHVPSRAAASRAHRQGTGEPRKIVFGPWMFGVVPFARQAQGPARHRVRHPFGYTEERRTERKLIADYEALLAEVLEQAHAGQSPRSRSASPPSRKRSAASATSRCATSRPPRPTRPRCWSSSAPGRAAAEGGRIGGRQHPLRRKITPSVELTAHLTVSRRYHQIPLKTASQAARG